MKVSTLWKAPLWLLELPTGAKSFRDNPLIGSRRLNDVGLHIKRMELAHRLAAWRRRRLAHLVSAEDSAAFDRDGFVKTADFLPADAFAALRDLILSTAAEAREMVQGDTITRRISLGDPSLRDAPAVRALIDNPRWRALLRYVASYDAEPLIYVQTILARHIEGPPDPQTNLHADTFHPTMKAWLYLTDVAADDGPLRYVPGSHRLTPARIAWEHKLSLEAAERDQLSARGSPRIAEADLAKLDLPPAETLAVAANTLIVADTGGFHARAQAAHRSVRIEIWAYGRRNPFLPFVGAHIGSIRGIAERRIAGIWRARDLLERWMGQPWRAVGKKRAGDE